MSGAHCGAAWDFNPTYNSGYEDGRKAAKAQIADLEQRLEYALRNLTITEKARQEEMSKRDELQRQVTELATTIEQLANIGGHHGG